MPPVWDTEADVWGQEAVDLFTYCRRTFGSLARVGRPGRASSRTDGRVLVGLVDRMGLRPVRWCSDKRGWLYIGSESGVFGLDIDHDRRQRPAPAGPDDRPRHRPPASGSTATRSWPASSTRRRPNSATFTS